MGRAIRHKPGRTFLDAFHRWNRGKVAVTVMKMNLTLSPVRKRDCSEKNGQRKLKETNLIRVVTMPVPDYVHGSQMSHPASMTVIDGTLSFLWVTYKKIGLSHSCNVICATVVGL